MQIAPPRRTLAQHAAVIRDWALYGPRDPQIAALVERLVIERQMQLDEIEPLIIETLAAHV